MNANMPGVRHPTSRPLRLALTAALGGWAITCLAAFGTAQNAEPMPLFYSGIAVENDVVYRLRSDGIVETQAVGSRRNALFELQEARPRLPVPGLQWEPLRVQN